ncbi:9769_t:CDS:1, partial [Acaulospora colombiana]
MLGPFGMSIDDVIDNIQNLGVTVFESVDVNAKTPLVDGQKLKNALETILKSKGVSSDTMLADIQHPSGCK